MRSGRLNGQRVYGLVLLISLPPLFLVGGAGATTSAHPAAPVRWHQIAVIAPRLSPNYAIRNESVAIDPRRRHVIVAVGHLLRAYDEATGRLVATRPFRPCSGPSWAVDDPVTDRLLVGIVVALHSHPPVCAKPRAIFPTAARVLTLDPSDLRVLNWQSVSPPSTDIFLGYSITRQIDTARHLLYVLSAGGWLHILDTGTGRQIRSVHFGFPPLFNFSYSHVLDPGTGRAYFVVYTGAERTTNADGSVNTQFTEPRVLSLGPPTFAVRTMTSVRDPRFVAIDPILHRLVVQGEVNRTYIVLLRSGHVFHDSSLSSIGYPVAVDPSAHRAVALNLQFSLKPPWILTILDTATGRVVRRVPVPAANYGKPTIAVLPRTHEAFMTRPGSRALLVLDTDSGSTIQHVRLSSPIETDEPPVVDTQHTRVLVVTGRSIAILSP